MGPDESTPRGGGEESRRDEEPTQEGTGDEINVPYGLFPVVGGWDSTWIKSWGELMSIGIYRTNMQE